MVNYSCDKCYKTFTQKSHYTQHQKRKNMWQNNSDKIKVLIDKAVEDKLNAIIPENTIMNKQKMDLNIINSTEQQTTPNMETKQTKGLNRNTIDKYYTKDIVVELCLNIVKIYIHINTDDLIVEPSAGNGSFITGIKSLSSNFRFYDLEPDNNEIIKQDYLLFDYDSIKKTFSKIHIIGNPPFGRQSSLAIKFIKKSCEFCDSVSFILPKSFKKDSLKKKFPLNFHLIFEIDLLEKSFLVDGVEHNVPCIFQIWEKKITNRVVNEKLEPVNFMFVEKTANPDISFRRVGVNAGTIDKEIDKKSIQSHYFIKFTNGKSITDNINKLSTITYDFNNTVGPKSISKQELIFKFNPLLEC
jgi:predicted RNA methylase